MIDRSATLTCAAVFVVALVGALVTTPFARRMAIRMHVVDHPSERKAHVTSVPYLGGLGIIGGFLVAMALGAVVPGMSADGGKVAMIFGGAACLAVMGLWDDLRPVPGWVKALVEVPLAVGVYAAGIRAELLGSEVLDLIVTAAWVAGITNAVNFLDNMDGITAGVAAIAGACMVGLAASSGLLFVACVAAALSGCALGFLRYNWIPATIFMGDAGSLFLGFLLACIALELRLPKLKEASFLIPIVVLGVPIFDTLMISVTRVLRGHSPLRPGLDHTSHRLYRFGLSRERVAGVHYAAALAFATAGFAIARQSSQRMAYVAVGTISAIFALVAVLLVRHSSST